MTYIRFFISSFSTSRHGRMTGGSMICSSEWNTGKPPRFYLMAEVPGSLAMDSVPSSNTFIKEWAATVFRRHVEKPT